MARVPTPAPTPTPSPSPTPTPTPKDPIDGGRAAPDEDDKDKG